MKRQIVLAFASLALLAACNGGSGQTFPGREKGPINKNGDSIISDQFTGDDAVFPDSNPRFVSLIKLNHPALLSSAKRKADGSYDLDEQLKQDILAEQIDIEKKLQNISADIKVVFKYQMVLNAVAVDAPQEFAEQINQLEVDFVEADERFHMPTTLETKMANEKTRQFVNTSMKHIGVDQARAKYKHINANGQEEPLLGQGVKVGIIDSGIDYTHAMLGGSGNVAQYQAIDADVANPAFPNDKVTGGYDFVGRQFNTRSHLYIKKLPIPDANPIDLGGHGTHVAGTVGGLGDGVNTYDGAAPQAELYALKVFGDEGGSTSDTVVIAALEFAADPNGDLKIDDKLDVVNLSLGGGFGKPHNLYAQAIKNLVDGGVVTVASAGNSGPINNIVGAPSTSNDAISVAASIDSMEHNWKFDAVEFKSKNNPSLLAEAVEGGLSKAIEETGQVSGKLVHIGEAAQELTPEVQAELKGHVALIDRGNAPFDDKFKRAVGAGAIGVVMVNNEPGPAIVMGGDLSFDVPGVMITLELGETIKKDMEGTDVSIDFVASKQIEKPELIDTITGFSSQGPRDLDGHIKPEITAPGFRIISARAGSGNQSSMLNGTSMSSPHIAGVAALVVQQKKNISAREVKSVLMNSSILISDAEKVQYPISRQGAGRVDVLAALDTDLVVSRPGLSLGKLPLVNTLNLSETLKIKNSSDSAVNYSLKPVNNQNLSLALSRSDLQLAPGEEVEINVEITAIAPEDTRVELDAFIEINQNGSFVGNIPVLGISNKSSAVIATDLSSVKNDPQAGDTVTLTLQNTHDQVGQALLFNLIGKDERKDQSIDPFFSVACDLESAGYRVVTNGKDRFLQIAVKIYNPVTTWRTCDIAVEIDKDGDGVSDIEIIGSALSSLPGLGEIPDVSFVSALFDSAKLRNMFENYSKELAEQNEVGPSLNYSVALQSLGPMVAFENSTIAIVDVLIDDLGLVANKAKFKIQAQANLGDVVERTDTLEKNGQSYIDFDLTDGMESYTELPEVVTVPANGSQQLDLLKGKGSDNLIVYFPRNAFTMNTQKKDSQSQELSVGDMPRIEQP